MRFLNTACNTAGVCCTAGRRLLLASIAASCSLERGGGDQNVWRKKRNGGGGPPQGHLFSASPHTSPCFQPCKQASMPPHRGNVPRPGCAPPNNPNRYVAAWLHKPPSPPGRCREFLAACKCSAAAGGAVQSYAISSEPGKQAGPLSHLRPAVPYTAPDLVDPGRLPARPTV